MKSLKTSLKSFRELFEQSIPVVHLAEPLVSFDDEEDPSRVVAEAREKGYDVVGYRRNGKVIGTVEIAKIGDRSPKDAMVEIGENDVIKAECSMVEVYRKIKGRTYLLVSNGDTIQDIITLGDLQKMPSRIWLFGIVSLAEMHAVRILKIAGPAPEEWPRKIGKTQYEKCKKSYDRLKKDKLDMSLADSLQIKDEFDLLSSNPSLFEKLGFTSKSSTRSLGEKLVALRNSLAHSHPIVGKVFNGLADLVDQIEGFIKAAEKFEKG